MNGLHLLRSALLFAWLLVGAAGVTSSFAGSDETPRINPELLKNTWSARWITVPNVSLFDYGVYHFRRTFELQAKPSSFVIHATGDNRYQLFVNGERVVWGPARGDLNHWRFETIDIAPHLKAGKNVLAAVVWNLGQYAPEVQVTDRTAFLLQGDTEAEALLTRTRSGGACANRPINHCTIPTSRCAAISSRGRGTRWMGRVIRGAGNSRNSMIRTGQRRRRMAVGAARGGHSKPA